MFGTETICVFKHALGLNNFHEYIYSVKKVLEEVNWVSVKLVFTCCGKSIVLFSKAVLEHSSVKKQMQMLRNKSSFRTLKG